MQILRMNTDAVVLDDELDRRWQLVPCNADLTARVHMVKGIFDDIADGLHQPITVAKQQNIVRTSQQNFLLFKTCPRFKPRLQRAHHLR
jgi:hypothetical protein